MSTFSDFPQDVICEILKHVKTSNLGKVALMNIRLNKICTQHVQTRNIETQKLTIIAGETQTNKYCNVFVDDDIFDLYDFFLYDRVYSSLSFKLENGTYVRFNPQNTNRSTDFDFVCQRSKMDTNDYYEPIRARDIKLHSCVSITVKIDFSTAFTACQNISNDYISKFCRNCGIFNLNENEDAEFLECYKCKKMYCDECHSKNECPKCKNIFCSSCADFEECDRCSDEYCSSCLILPGMARCDSCYENLCDKCDHLVDCDGCDRHLCDSHMSDCSNCEDSYCWSCLKSHLCPSCYAQKFGSDGFDSSSSSDSSDSNNDKEDKDAYE